MFVDAVLELASILDGIKVGYCLINDTALFMQGVLCDTPESIEVSIQWDALEHVYDTFAEKRYGPLEKGSESGQFRGVIQGIPIIFVGFYNTVVATDMYRVAVSVNDTQVWVKSLYFYHEHGARTTTENCNDIQSFLGALQERNGEVNREAWNQHTYDAWINRHGVPQEAAAKIKRNPIFRLQPWFGHIANVSTRLDGMNIMNLLGSHGGKAVAMALLGAKVTVVDISEANRQYALDVAHEAGVYIRYIVEDVLRLPEEELAHGYDVVLLELGVLHYFVDLYPLFRVVSKLLRPNGKFVLHEFHPVSTKLITSSGKKHKVTGNYFDFEMETRSVAHSKYGADENQPLVHLRKWTLGEIVSAVASSGLRITALEEEPNHKMDDIGIPKTFTLVAVN